MSNLSGFLAQNALPVENIKYVASKRFLDDNKQPLEWEIKCITSTEDEELRKSCTRRIPLPGGRKGQYTQETEYTTYISKLAANCTVFPNLNDAELQDSYKVMGAEALLKRMLSPGEYADYVLKVQEINGFQTLQEDIDEAKNL
jgi:hypothetical protein